MRTIFSVSLYLISILITSTTYAQEIKINLKHNVMNFSNEVNIYVSGDYELNRYVVRPKTDHDMLLEVYDTNSTLWRSNLSLWSDQIFVEHMGKIKFHTTSYDNVNVYFELLDLRTSNKYISTIIPVFSNKEAINFLNTLNQNLKKSD